MPKCCYLLSHPDADDLSWCDRTWQSDSGQAAVAIRAMTTAAHAIRTRTMRKSRKSTDSPLFS